MSTPNASVAKDQVHLHAWCWNDARMLPYFFRHYNEIVDRFFIYDSGATDGSVARLAGDERVRVVPWAIGGDSIFEAGRLLANECWKLSRGAADWVFLVDMNEHLFHPDLRRVLRMAARDGATAVKALGYEMIAEQFPDGDRPLTETVTRGVRLPELDRLAVFSPDAILETNFAVGRHTAEPVGRLAWETRYPLALLRYERLGVEHVCERNAFIAARLYPGDLARGYGAHCRMSRDGVAAQHAILARMALPVPLLGGAGGAAAKMDLDAAKSVLSRSGLFLGAWYLRRYPDVAAAGIEPLEHFCRSGWREGRRPNPHFDPAWYSAAYGQLIGDANPLLDYVLEGEQLGRKPEPDFDPIEHRFRHRLACAESPLRHRLLRELEASPTG